MKKILFGLIATVFFGLSAQDSFAQGKLVKYLVGIDIDIKFGQNKVIGGKRYSCIDGGFCSITVGRVAQTTNIKETPKDSPFFALDKEGNFYLVAHVSFKRDEFRKEFTLETGTTIDDQTAQILNKEILAINPKANKINSLSKGKVLTPVLNGEHYLIKLN